MSTDMPTAAEYRRQAGISLIETIMFIVIVSVGVVGLVSVMNSTVKHSADPMIRKQAIAVAESLMEEITLQPFTNCDPDAYDVGTQTCSTNEALGPETIGGVTETRRGDAPFDNVNDYHGFSMPNGITSITDGLVIGGLENYRADVTIAEVGGNFNFAAAEVLRITVTVREPGWTAANAPDGQVTLTGYRFRYSPMP